MAHPHDRRDIQAAGQDGGMGEGPAMLGDQGHGAAMAQQQGIGGGDVVGDDDAARDLALRFLAGLVSGGEKAQDVVDDLVDIVAPAAQVGVVHLVEDPRQVVAVLAQGPLGGKELVTDQVPRRLDQGRVLKDQEMGSR
jgi:hypothetical protein